MPQPKVDSAVLRLTNIHHPENLDIKEFFKVVKAGFSSPRKQLINNFQTQLKLPKEDIISWLSNNNIDSTRRAETLSIEEWKNLTIDKKR